MENPGTNKIFRIIVLTILAICLGVIGGFMIVYWRISLIALAVTVILIILARDHKEFTK